MRSKYQARVERIPAFHAGSIKRLLALLAFVGSVASFAEAQMIINHTQHTYTPQSSVACPPLLNAQIGDLLAAEVYNNATTPTLKVTDNQGNVYTPGPLLSISGSGFASEGQVFWVRTGATGSTTITVQQSSGATKMGIMCQDIRGIPATGNYVDGKAVAQNAPGVTNAMATPVLATSGGCDFLLGMFVDEGSGGPFTPEGGATQIDTDNPFAAQSLYLACQPQGSYQIESQNTQSDASWQGFGVAFLSGGTQALPPTCTPPGGTFSMAQTVTCSSSNNAPVIICGAVAPTVPVSNGLGTGCNTGTAPPFTVSASETLNVIAGTNILPDSPVVPYVFQIGSIPTPCSPSCTIINQPSTAGPAWYPNGLPSIPLPNAGNGGPTTHLMPGSDAAIVSLVQATSSGDTTVQPINNVNAGYLTGDLASVGAQDEGALTLYISTITDPVYQVVNVKDCGPVFAPFAIKNDMGVITNLLFHAPLQAIYSGTDGVDATFADNNMTIWDMSGDSLDISNGHVLSFYGIEQTTLPAKGGYAGTISDPIPYSAPGDLNYCAWDDPVNGTGYGQNRGGVSVGFGGFAGMDRFQEILAGHAYHAGFTNEQCEGTLNGNEPYSPPRVFPSVGGALPCSDQTNPAAPNGSLFFYDYTDTQLDCMNPAKASCTGSDRNPVPKLNPIQFVFVEQMSHYGQYETDTSGPASWEPSSGDPDLVGTYHNESSSPYLYYGLNGTMPNPYTGNCPECFGTAAATFEGVENAQCLGPTYSATWCYPITRSAPNSISTWQMRYFYGMPFNLPGSTCSNQQAASGQCGFAKHLKIADPCVAVSMANLKVDPTGRWTNCFPLPGGQQYGVTVMTVSNGSVTSVSTTNPAGTQISVGANASQSVNFFAYSQLTLTAAPSGGASFIGWGGTGPCSGSSPICIFRLTTAPGSIIATFSGAAPTAPQHVQSGVF